MLKYGKYFKSLFNFFLSQLSSNSVLFCSLFLNSDYSFSNFSGNVFGPRTSGEFCQIVEAILVLYVHAFNRTSHDKLPFSYQLFLST